MRRLIPILAFATSLLASGMAQAGWQQPGDTLRVSPHEVGTMTIDPDGTGGWIVTWMSLLGPFDTSIFAARVSSAGDVYPNWDWSGSSAAIPKRGAPDGFGGMFKTFGGSSPGLYHILPSGGADPAWPSTGVHLPASQSASAPAAANDGAGGALVAYGVGPYLLVANRVLANATLAPGWPAGGLTLSDGTNGPVVGSILAQADGGGGAYVAWSDSYVQLQRITGTGGISAGWPAGGLSFGTANLARTFLPMFPSGANDLFLSWYDDSSNARRIWLQRIHNDGTIAPGWPASGKRVYSGTTGTVAVHAVSDGIDGCEVMWLDGSMPRAVRVLADGSLAPGWPTAGAALVDDNAAFVNSFRLVQIAAGASGGTVVAWTDHRRPGAIQLRVRWLAPDGSPDPAQPDTGLVLGMNGQTDDNLVGAILSDGNGGAYVGWVYYDAVFGYFYFPMLAHVPYPATTAVPPLAPVTHSLELAAPWPNPARDMIQMRMRLPDDAPARLELLDLAGRRLGSRDMFGAGEHVERFDHLESLAPGLYLIRLTQGSRSSTVRVALLH